MAFNVDLLFKKIQQQKELKEVYIQQDGLIFYGVLGNEAEGQQGLINIKDEEIGMLDVEDCKAILRVFEKANNTPLTPAVNGSFNFDNELYRLIVSNSPTLVITYRELHEIDKSKLNFHIPL